MTLVEARRNGTGAPMAVQTVRIELEKIGYPDRYVLMRTNPRTSVYQALATYGTYDAVADGEDQQARRDEQDRGWWKAFGQIVIEWNLTDEDGHPLPHPREVEREKDLDLPIKLHTHVLTEYFGAVWAETELPKVPSDNSGPISSTSEGSPKNG